jgi:ribosomal protein S18 acetylase RimI-like enzyme
VAEPRIRRLEERDIDTALALTDLEGWGYTHADFARLLALSPNGCFVAEDEGRVIGVLSTTTYERLAFLGAVIVSPESRGRGVGRLLMRAALLHLAAGGVDTVRLNAYLDVVRFYERLEFRREYEVLRWRGTASPRAAGPVSVATREDMAALERFDAAFFGASRRTLLELLLQENPATFLVAREGPDILGYLVGSPFDGSCEIGPWVVAPGQPLAARDLFHALVNAVGSREYSFSGPERNPELLRFVQEVGFSEVFHTLRMWRGKNLYPGDPAGVWASGGLEKG